MSYGRSDATPLKNIKGKLKETTRNIIEVININGRHYPVQILVLLPGSLLYTASRNGLDFSHTGWFGIKREDVVQYGNKIETFQSNQDIKILDLSLSENQIFVDAILDESGKSIFNKNWVVNRETYRSGDFLVSKQLKQKLPNYEIYGFGTGRGKPYEDSSTGHHAEIALFPNAYNSLQLINVENREEAVDDARGHFARIQKRKRDRKTAAARASRMKRKRRIRRGLNLGGPDEEASLSSSRSISPLIDPPNKFKRAVKPRTSESFMERLGDSRPLTEKELIGLYISDSDAENLADFF